MARKTTPRDLPALRSVQPHFRGFPAADHHLDSLVTSLRMIIDQLRGNEPRTFYTQRDLSRFFRVPPRTVTLACRRLQAEGLLNCVRSSATYITPLKRQPRHPVRGVVGIAIWETGFADLRHQREFYRELERALRRLNYVADFVFYEAAGRETDFAEQLRAHHLDYLVWFAPLPTSAEMIHLLADGGVQPFVIGHEYQPAPFQKYLLSQTSAYLRALTAWHREGVREIIWTGGGAGGDLLQQTLQHRLAPLRLRWRFAPMIPDDVIGYLTDLPSGPEVGLVFPSDLINNIICRFSQSALLALIRRSRVLVNEPLPLVQPPPEDIRIDLLRTDWPRLARRIAADIASEHPPSPAEQPFTLPARWLPRQPVAPQPKGAAPPLR